MDLLRTMERVMRRAQLPLAYSEGFNPHPKVSFGSALAVGVTSAGEYMDVELIREMEPSQVKEALDNSMPPAIKVQEIITIETRSTSLNALINRAHYQTVVRLTANLAQSELESALKGLMENESLVVTRRGKKGPRQIDIRPGIFNIKGNVENDRVILQMELQTGEQGNVKPEEVVQILGGNLPLGDNLRIHRLGLFISSPCSLQTPLDRT